MTRPLSSSEPEPSGPPPASVPVGIALPRGVVLVALLVLVGFLGWLVSALWGEWQALRADRAGERASTLVGYADIYPTPQYAARPTDWVHDEGDDMLLWSGWQPGVGHRWFRVGRGELDRARLGGSLGRDIIRAIDVPIVEVGGGPRWGRIPWDAPVAALDLEGIPSAYPLRVLEKVEVVNDAVRDRPILVTFSPFIPEAQAYNVYEPVVEGRRVTLGSSGYFLDRRPLLYDRGTESLWIERTEGLTAIAGRRKGALLRRVSRPTLIPWGRWQARYPKGRLVVGADRSGGLPAD
jgi:hypothetical protein